MKFIFWQNILSIHQSAFIRNLAETNDVTLIAEQGINEERVKHGWNVPDFGKTTIVISPDDDQIFSLLDRKDVAHIFTGIKSFPMVYKVFKLAIKKNCKILIQSEPYNWVDSKAWLRSIKYKLLYFQYGKCIDGILAISSAARMCYIKAGFTKNKIFDWAYFTEIPAYDRSEILENEKPNVIFVGSIDERKNILGILPVIKKHSDKIDKFIIIGRGDLEEKLNQFTDNKKIIYKGGIPNTDIANYFLKSDILILPSTFDGWGAVVNEALTLGTPVLCSHTCGSSDLIKDNRGKVFSNIRLDFEEKYLEIIKQSTVGIDKRMTIMNWAASTISGHVASDYFINVITALYYNGKKPVAPWMKK